MNRETGSRDPRRHKHWDDGLKRVSAAFATATATNTNVTRISLYLMHACVYVPMGTMYNHIYPLLRAHPHLIPTLSLFLAYMPSFYLLSPTTISLWRTHSFFHFPSQPLVIKPRGTRDTGDDNPHPHFRIGGIPSFSAFKPLHSFFLFLSFHFSLSSLLVFCFSLLLFFFFC